MNNKNKFVLFIYTALPGYMFSCIERLAAEVEYKIILVETSRNENYPVKYSSKHFDIVDYSVFRNIKKQIRRNDIQKIFITGWANKRIRELADNYFKQKVKLILLSDQAKKNNLKQRFGKSILKGYLNKFVKVIVPGKSGSDLMVYYGVPKANIQNGLYTADDQIFNDAKSIRDGKKHYPKCFLFDGQFIERKGVPFLIQEYSEYRRLSKNPWELVMVGKGELENTISESIKNLGFVNQKDLREVYAGAGCFVLPSYEDHWPLVIHQAVCSGLPILISSYCTNHFEFFRESVNGYFIDPKTPGSLVKAMLQIENTIIEDIRKMGEFSFNISKSFSVDKWVEQFKVLIKE